MSGSICGGGEFHVRLRRAWPRPHYDFIGKPTRSYRTAVIRLARAFADEHEYVKGEVVMTADYYDPVRLCEISR